MSEITEYYELLGCQYGESLGSVKKKFMSLAIRFHPDKGGDKCMFDLICNAYKKIREIRKFEDCPKEDVKYANDLEVTFNEKYLDNENYITVKSIEKRLSAGYDDFSGRVAKEFQNGLKEHSKEHRDLINYGNFEYDPNDIDIKHETPTMVSKNSSKYDKNVDDINYEGRDTDVTNYFNRFSNKVVEYGKFDTTFGSKGTTLGGYDLGNALAPVKIINEALDNQEDFEPVEDLLENCLEEREQMENKIGREMFEGPHMGGTDTENKRNNYFDKKNDDYTFELQKNSEKMYQESIKDSNIVELENPNKRFDTIMKNK